MNIRQATSDDAQTLAQLNVHVQQVHADARPEVFKPPIDDAWVEAIADRIRSLEGTFFIAEIDGEAVGYLYAEHIERPDNVFTYVREYVLIDQMSVNPEYYGTGVADQLMQTVKDWTSAQGIERIVLGVWAFNQRAIRFYEKQGFTHFIHRMELMLE